MRKARPAQCAALQLPKSGLKLLRLPQCCFVLVTGSFLPTKKFEDAAFDLRAAAIQAPIES